MELEPTSGSPHVLTQVFRNDRGLRAGWRLLIFFAIVIGIPRRVIWAFVWLPGRPPAGQPPAAIAPWPQLFAGCGVFLWVLLVTWIMSRIEHRPVGSYGLPLVRSAVPRFLSGYLLWGFLPIT